MAAEFAKDNVGNMHPMTSILCTCDLSMTPSFPFTDVASRCSIGLSRSCGVLAWMFRRPRIREMSLALSIWRGSLHMGFLQEPLCWQRGPTERICRSAAARMPLRRSPSRFDWRFRNSSVAHSCRSLPPHFAPWSILLAWDEALQ